MTNFAGLPTRARKRTRKSALDSSEGHGAYYVLRLTIFHLFPHNAFFEFNGTEGVYSFSLFYSVPAKSMINLALAAAGVSSGLPFTR